MSRIEELREKVTNLYLAKDPQRAAWADWLFKNHIFVVTKKAEEIAARHGANGDLAMAAAMLHDVADSIIPRHAEQHEAISLEMALSLLRECNFSEAEIAVVVDDAILFHGCHGENIPKTMEGKVMATADAMAHLQTDFYDFALGAMQAEGSSMDDIRNWALPKIERDYRKKIFFDEIRREVSADYERAKKLFTV